MTSVLIIDDHPIVLQGCRRMLEDAGVKTVLEARDATSGYRLYRRHRPDVVIVDLAMQGGGLGGLEVIRRMRSHDPRSRILVFSMHSDPIIAARALEAGATGYVLKDSNELMKAFDQVRSGKPYGRIAEELNVSYKTVVNACSQLKQKLNAKNLPELIRAAVQLVSAES